MNDSQSLDELIARLVLLRQRAGTCLFREALRAARVAVGRTMLAEAERRAGLHGKSASFVRFPDELRFRNPASAKSSLPGD